MDKWGDRHRRESPEINPHTDERLVNDKDGFVICEDKMDLSIDKQLPGKKISWITNFHFTLK